MAVVRPFELAKINLARYNPRTITPENKEGLREALTTLGVLDMPVVNVKDGKDVVVAGHQRIELLIAEGVRWCDCVAVSFDDDKEIAANLSLNNPAIQGTYDFRKALPELESIRKTLPKPDSLGLATLLDEVRRESVKIETKESLRAAASAANNVPPESAIKPVSKPQMTYELGPHRLYCGAFEVGIPKLLKGAKAAACVTDPPYNVDYNGWCEPVVKSDEKKIENDDMLPEDWSAFVEQFVKITLANTDGPCYVFMSSKELPMLCTQWEQAGGVINRQLIWAKDKITSAHRGDYHFQCEPILYGYRSGLKPFIPASRKTNVLEFAKPKVGANKLHLAQKPVELLRSIVEDCGEVGDVIIDLFGGSGTTLVVCEELNRVCFTSEIDLFHCDTIRRRWAEQVHGAGCEWKKLTPAE